jgi:UDP-N-acetylmuramoyl-tripeptide--D-alanyl-D-alanine ligase
VRLTLDDIVQATGGRLDGAASGGKPITGVSTDTRTIHPGDLFVPLRGPRQDGHDFIAQAFASGAAASLTQRPPSPPGRAPTTRAAQPGARAGPLVHVADTLRALADLAAYYRRRVSATIVGITGSVGKTTTAAMCAAALGRRFTVVRTQDNWNAEIGVPLTVLGLRAGDDVAVIEMAMRGLGQIADLVRIAAPQIGVVTNIGETHLELLGSLDIITQAKSELVEGLPSDGTAVLNADDPRALGLRTRSRAAVLTYGVARTAAIRAEDAAFTDGGMRFRLIRPDGDVTVALPTWGTHLVSNALAAAAVAHALGVGLDDVRQGLASWAPARMRLQPLRAGDVLVLNDAYNASPASLAAAFEVLAHVGRGRRRLVVLGEMRELGPQSPDWHREAGARVAAVASVLIAAGGSDAAALVEGARGTAGVDVHLVPDAPAAAASLLSLIRPGDVVLIKGSRAMGMERVVDAVLASTAPPGSARR